MGENAASENLLKYMGECYWNWKCNSHIFKRMKI
jgi:hypothetical protein